MFFEKVVSPGLAHFSYLIGDGKELAVIDPRRDIQVYLDIAHREGMTIKAILETHRNEDYTIGSLELAEKSGAAIYLSGHEDLGHVYGQAIYDGHEITVGSLRLKAIHTPGHTLGHLAYAVYEAGRREAFLVFSGDCLFMGDLGRTDFYGPDNLAKMTGLLYDSVVDKLFPLGDHVVLCPAHGFGSACGASMEDRPFSTIGYERLHNPELQVSSREEFIEKFARMRIKPRYFSAMEVNNVKGAPFVGHATSLPALSLEDVAEQGIQLFDVRDKEAAFGGHIPGSLYLSQNNFSVYAANLVELTTPIGFIVPDNKMETVMKFYYMARRIGFDHVAGYLPDGVSQWQTAAKALAKLNTIPAEDYLALRDDSLVIDIRQPHDLSDDDPVHERLNLPLEELYRDYVKIPSDRPLYILCGVGDRSATAASLLKQHGISAAVIEGGLRALKTIAK